MSQSKDVSADQKALVAVGARLQQARAAWGLYQEDIARVAGISRQAYGYWETGKFEPSVLKLGRIAEYLSVSVDWLLTGKGEAPAISSDKAALRRMIRTAQERLDALDHTHA